ncbi:TPA: hypothetical protein NIE58_006090 [Pseudomonas aeruginosa]|nr:hypothetical protein [Pseudomonas aeruginosa]HCF4376573.1 hypothetical protein [Pseudomonas aeruginosa]
MNATSILKVIEGLGKSYEELVTKSIIPKGILEEPYDGCDHLTNSPEEGIELAFEKDTNRLDKISFLLIRTVGELRPYAGDLPQPFSKEMDKAGVRSVLGVPEDTKEPFKMPVIGLVGGWDYYAYLERPEIKVFFSYTAEMKVDTLSFILKESVNT